MTNDRHPRGLRQSMTPALPLLALLLVSPRTNRAAGPEPGTMIGPDTAEQAEGLIPPEFLDRYKKGEWRHVVATPKRGTHLLDPEWIEAGKGNAGKFIINDEGSIREIATGKQPASIWGVPFPTIDPKDPKAGYQMLWNFFYQSYLIGDDQNMVNLVWIERGGPSRQLKTQVTQKFYDGQKPFRLPKQNPLNLLFQQFVRVHSPADVQGTTTVTWRYRDARRDSNWAYVPALRRVRQVSPSNRSDGSFGSDMSQDDGSYFDGKPEDFEAKVIGEGEELFLLDKASVVDGVEDLRPLPDGGWRAVYADKPRFDYQRPDFNSGTQMAWAPVTENYVLVKRPVWIVELTPKDTYYLYGKLILRLDKENWYGCYESKYDWKGAILNSYLPMHGAWFKKGDDYRGYGAGLFTLSQNFRLERATASLTPSDPTIPSDTLVTVNPDQFDVDALARSGK